MLPTLDKAGIIYNNFVMIIFVDQWSRLEKRGWGTSAGKAKVMGTLVGIVGAMLLTFYKGPELGIWPTHVGLLHKNHPLGGHANEVHQKSVNHVLGALLALGSCVCFASWFILQVSCS